MNAFEPPLTFSTLESYKRNMFSKEAIRQIANEFSSINDALAYFNDVGSYSYKTSDIDILLKKYIFKNLYATCHAINETEFLSDLHEKAYGDFMFAFRVNHVRKILLLQIMNPIIPKSIRSNYDDETAKDGITYSKLIELFRVNERTAAFKGDTEIVDFGFMKCAMELDHEYGIQDVLAVVHRILRSKYLDSLEDKLQEATFIIPLDGAKYGMFCTIDEFNSFKLNGMLLDITNQRDVSDLIDSVQTYKKTQYDYRISTLTRHHQV